MNAFTEILKELAELSQKSDSMTINPAQAAQIRQRIINAAQRGYYGQQAQDAFLSIHNMILDSYHLPAGTEKPPGTAKQYRNRRKAPQKRF